MDNFLKNKFIKSICVYVLPILIGWILPPIESFDYQKDKLFWWKLAILVILIVWYVYTTIKYLGFEKKLENEIENKKKTIEDINSKLLECNKINTSFSKETRALSTLCLDSAQSINELADKVLVGKRTLDTWNFVKVSTGICDSIYNILCSVCDPFDEFTVNILLDDITAKGKKKNYTMIAHKGKYENYPSKFQEKMYYKDNPNFYATKLFENGKSDIKILTTKNEINEKFIFSDDSHPEYSQYVGIPIICSGNKMICLLQICSIGSNKIAENKKDIMSIVKTYIIPFTQFALLNYKVEKGFLNSFSVIGEMEEKKNGE